MLPSDTILPPYAASTHSQGDPVRLFKSKLASLRTQLDEQEKTVVALKAALRQSKQREVQIQQECQQELEMRVEARLKECNETITKHVGFINQLLADKQDLSQRLMQGVEDSKATQRNFEQRLQAREEEFQGEMNRAREAWKIQERQRRERWISTREKHIKENTAKAIEPEIRRLVQKHKVDCQRLQAEFQEETQRIRQRINTEHEGHLARQRAELMQRFQQDLELTNESNRRKLEEQADRMQRQAEAERQRWAQQLQQEQEKTRSTVDHARQEANIALNKYKDIEERSRVQVRTEHERQLADLRRRHTEETEHERAAWLIEKDELEKQAWQRMEVEMKKRVDEIESQFLRERDEEITEVVSKVEDDAALQCRDLTAQHEAQLTSLRESHSNEIEEMRRRESKWMKLCEDLTNSEQHMKSEVERMQAETSQLETQLANKAALADRFQRDMSDRANSLDYLKKDHSEAIRRITSERKHEQADMHQQIESLQEALDRLKQQHESELEDLLAEKETEMDAVESRVRALISQKDQQIRELESNLTIAETRASECQALLDKQRTEFLGLTEFMPTPPMSHKHTVTDPHKHTSTDAHKHTDIDMETHPLAHRVIGCLR